MIQRGPWVVGTPTHFDYFVDYLRSERLPVAVNPASPAFISQQENDPIADRAPIPYEGIEQPKGGSCASLRKAGQACTAR